MTIDYVRVAKGNLRGVAKLTEVSKFFFEKKEQVQTLRALSTKPTLNPN